MSTRIGRYEVTGEIGRGGMGVVYRAFDPGLARSVAIKVVLDPRLGARARERLLQEARAAARLGHPGIVGVHEVAQDERGRPYLVMDLVEGETLEHAGGGRPDRLPPRRLAEVVREVALALAHAHERGVVHRDVKPANVLLDREGRARLLDFGLARAIEAQSGLTASGELVGTPQFMAPEQVRGGGRDRDAIGPTTDVYGLGGLLYWGLTGAAPARGESVAEVLRKVVAVEPTPPRRIDARIHPDLETIALRCLEKEPARRYARAADVAEELERYVRGEAILARPLGRLARARRWAARNRLLAAALLAAGLLVLASLLVAGGSVLVVRRRVAAERARLLDDMAQRARETAAALDAARAEAPSPAVEAPEQARARSDRLLALGLRALGTAGTRAALAPGDAAARDEALARALALAAVGRETEQWGVAAGALDWAAELGADPARLRREREALEQAREALARRHREAVAAVLAAARSGELFERREGREDGVFELVRYAERQTVEMLAAELGAITEALHDAADAALLEAAGGAGAPEVADLAAALARARALEPLEPPDEAMRAAIARAEARLVARERKRSAPDGPASGPEARSRALLAAAQERAVGTAALRTARLCCEALGRIGIEAAATEALGAYLAAERDELRAVEAGIALCRIGGERAERLLLATRDRLGADGTFWRQVSRLLGRTGVQTPLAEDSAFGYLERGLVRYTKGELDAAIADFDRAIELDPREANAFCNRGNARKAQGDLEGALADYDEAIRLDPTYADAFNNRGLVRKDRGDLAGAVADFDRAIELGGEDAQTLSNRGVAHRARGDVARSIADLDRAIALDPDFAFAFNNRGLARQLAGDLAGAIADFDRAIALDPRFAQAFSNRALAHQARGDLAAAIADLDRAIELEPRLAGVVHNRGLARAARGDLVGAIADFDRAVELDPGFAKAFADRGTARQMQGDLAGAIADLDRAIEIDPRFADALINRGVARRDRGDLAGAIADHDRAIEIAPSSARAFYSRGVTRQGAGDLAGAAADFSRAVEIAPDYANARVARALVRAAAGDRAGAIADLERFLQIEPTGRFADEVREQLRRLRGR